MKKMLLASALMLALAALPAAVSAQKQFTLEDLNFGGTNYRNMIAQNRTTTWWGSQLVRLDADTCFAVNTANGRERVLLTAKEVGDWAGEPISSCRALRFPYAGKPLVMVTTSRERLLIDFKKKSVAWRQPLAPKAKATLFCPANRAVAQVGADCNLRVTDAQGHTEQLTTDGSREIVYGQSVHRDEFGIDGGLFWSPKGNKLAFYRMDQSMVADYPQVTIPEVTDSAHRMATPAPDKYPMAGCTSHKVTVGVYDLATRHIEWLKAGDPTDRYFTNISWSPDERTIYMQELNRGQNDCRLVSYDAASGHKIGELYRTTSDKYVEPLHPIVFLPWDDTKFVMQSQKDGFNHLYLFDTNGRQLRQITSGHWVVMQLMGFNTKHHSIIYASNELDPRQRNLWMVDVNTGKRALIDADGTGWHQGSVSPDGTYIVDNYQTPTVARKIAIVNTENGRRTPWFTAPDPWQGYSVPTYESGTLKAADGVTDLYWRLVKPADFDPAKKYPTVVYVYGGPHAHNVDARWHWGSRSWETYMAQRGYVLFILDNRGSENRGLAFEQATWHQLGQVEMQDQMMGVNWLRQQPWCDTTRMGIHGWSFGGFMTISLMTNHPGTFKVGVAGGPVIDWKWYEVMYGERYMGTPQNNPEGYAKTSLLHQARNLKDRLEIIIGLNDATVVPQHALTFLKACIAAGTQPDFFVYPGEPHNMRGHQSVHLHERITRYFDDHLK